MSCLGRRFEGASRCFEPKPVGLRNQVLEEVKEPDRALDIRASWPGTPPVFTRQAIEASTARRWTLPSPETRVTTGHDRP